jgi:hypothetical protein
MKNLNSFYIIGTVGMVVSACLHILLSIIISDGSVHPVFIGIYPTFFTFLIIGAFQLKKAKKLVPVKRPTK